MKSRCVSFRKNPAGSPENKKICYPGKGTRFDRHLFITFVKNRIYTVIKHTKMVLTRADYESYHGWHRCDL